MIRGNSTFCVTGCCTSIFFLHEVNAVSRVKTRNSLKKGVVFIINISEKRGKDTKKILTLTMTLIEMIIVKESGRRWNPHRGLVLYKEREYLHFQRIEHQWQWEE